MDWFHAYAHLTAIAQILGGPETQAPQAWRDRLEAGDSGRLVRQAGKHLPAPAQSKKSRLKQLRYFEKMPRKGAMPNIMKKNPLGARVWSRPAAARSSGSALNNPECAGPCPEPMPSLPRVVASSPVDSKIFGPAAPRSSHFYLVHPHGVSRRLALTLGRWFAAYPEANAAHWRAFHTRARLTMDSLRQLGPQIVKAASNVRSFLFPAESRCEPADPADSCPCVRGRSGLSSSHRWSTCRKIRSR